MDNITTFKNLGNQTITQLREDLKSFRTGRANPGMLEGLMIEAYGGSTKLRLMEMSTITTEGPAALVVVPFDPSTAQDIEKAILKSPLGLSPQPQGSRIIVRVPPLSQEQREKFLKLVSQKVEEKKGVIRNHRDDVRRKIKTLQESKEITEDDRFRFEKEIDTITQNMMNEMQGIKESKEKEIMEV